MRLTSLALWPLCACLVTAQAYDYGVDVDIQDLTRRSDQEPIVIEQLLLNQDGSVPLRLEIRDLRKDPYKWDLYILALNMFQRVSQDNPLSWYQIAGLHGAPYISWNGVEATPGANLSGYCSHSSVLFPTWHRPYLALYEQQLYRMVNVIAGLFPNITERHLYQQAASDFRIPYWDWSMDAPKGDTFFPGVMWNATMVQYGPREEQRIKNPLYSYHFHPKDEDALIWSPLNQWDETKRAPNVSKSITNPPSNNALVNDALLFKLPEIRRRLFALFSTYKDYNSFSCKSGLDSQNVSTWDSLEAIHDIIHTYGGLNGHMTYIPLSAFDPLFFLHHAMTDRLFAMWQSANPTAWMQPQRAGQTSFTTPKGTMQQSNSSLTPFFVSADGTFWDSDMSRDTEAFGYAYPEATLPLKREDPRTELIKKITAWYGGDSPANLPTGMETHQQCSHKIGEFRKGGNSFAHKRPNVRPDAKSPPRSCVVRNGQYTEWIANVAVKVGALGGKYGALGSIYSIYFFLGEVPKETSDWNTASNRLGSVDFRDMTMNMDTDSDTMITGTLPLTTSLTKMVAAGEIPHLGVDAVEPFLQETLHFRVLIMGKGMVDPREVAGLIVKISSAEVQAPRSEAEFPQWGPATVRFDLWADGKPGI